MLKKTIMVLAAAAMLAGFTACSSVETAPQLNNLRLTENPNATSIAHLNGQVWGVYFLNLLPVFTGNTAKIGQCVVFRDTVKIENATRMITKKAASLDATSITDLTSCRSDFWIFPFTVKTIDISGNAVK
ncbi:MAG: hypothetical protein IJW23_06230 [Lentisphaeria bacterium]|nr:hypothetical protein [Lentisphaeria bacterium]